MLKQHKRLNKLNQNETVFAKNCVCKY